MMPICIAAIVVVAALLIYELVPHLARPRDPFYGIEEWTRVPAAHRGLHGTGAPENSCAAFERAARAGLMIEMDVRLCRDALIVLHDGFISLPNGRRAHVRSMTLDEIRRVLPYVPTLRDALKTIGGRVPVIIDIKCISPRLAVRTVRALAVELYAYSGKYCLESFNPHALISCRRLLPHTPRGQLVASPKSMRRSCGTVAGWALGNLLFNPLARPHFVAYEWGTPTSRGLRAWEMCGGACAVWTVSDCADAQFALSEGMIVICK